MTRKIDIGRDEAEMLVDILEARTLYETDKRLDWLAEDIRKLFGMVTKGG